MNSHSACVEHTSAKLPMEIHRQSIDTLRRKYAEIENYFGFPYQIRSRKLDAAHEKTVRSLSEDNNSHRLIQQTHGDTFGIQKSLMWNLSHDQSWTINPKADISWKCWGSLTSSKGRHTMKILGQSNEIIYDLEEKSNEEIFGDLEHEYSPDRRQQLHNRLFDRNKPLAKWVARRFRGVLDSDVLEQVSNLGLMEAISDFDLNHGTKFSTHATHTIEYEIRGAIRAEEKAWPAYIVFISLTAPTDDNGDFDISELAGSCPMPEEVVIEKEEEEKRNILWTLVNSILPPILAEIIHLQFWRGFRSEEIAHQLQISRATFYRWREKAFAILEANWEIRECAGVY